MTESDDQRLSDAFATVVLSDERLGQLEGRVLAAHTLSHRPLSAEWVEILRVRPVVHGGLIVAAAVVLLFATPIGALLSALLSGAGVG